MSASTLTAVALERQMSPIRAKLSDITRHVAAMPSGETDEAFAFRKDRIVSSLLSVSDWVGEIEARMPVAMRSLDADEKPVIYLAAPYSSARTATRQARFKAANEAAVWLMRQGYTVISPISMGHPIAEAGPVGGGFEVWQRTCLHLLDAADALVVLNITGTADSLGVQAEYRHATRRGLPVSLLYPVGKAYTITRNATLTFRMPGDAA